MKSCFCWFTDGIWKLFSNRRIFRLTDLKLWETFQCWFTSALIIYECNVFLSFHLTVTSSLLPPVLSYFLLSFLLTPLRFLWLQVIWFCCVSPLLFLLSTFLLNVVVHLQLLSSSISCLSFHLIIPEIQTFWWFFPLPPLTLRTMLSSMFVFLLLPCLPISVISSWQKGLGRMSHCVKNFLHSTM